MPMITQWKNIDIICGIQYKMKMWSRLLKNYEKFQDGNQRAESAFAWGFSATLLAPNSGCSLGDQ